MALVSNLAKRMRMQSRPISKIARFINKVSYKKKDNAKTGKDKDCHQILFLKVKNSKTKRVKRHDNLKCTLQQFKNEYICNDMNQNIYTLRSLK